jgi:signal transduction histidine kinase
VICADPLQMHQLLENLIGNALKFHKPGEPPLVRIQSKRTFENQVDIIVADNGIGFHMDQADKLFQPFHRLVGRSEYEGTGMGLAICRKIVERQQGSITVQSSPGQGTTFTVSLPIDRS